MSMQTVISAARPVRRALAALAAVSTLALAAPASAGPGVIVPLTEIFSVYKSICVANAGKPEAQIKTATSSAFGFELAGTDDDGTRSFETDRLSLRIMVDGNRSFCMVMGDVSNSTSLAQGQALGEPMLGKPEVVSPENEDGQSSVLWAKNEGGQQLVYIYIQMGNADRTVSGYMLGAE